MGWNCSGLLFVLMGSSPTRLTSIPIPAVEDHDRKSYME